MKEPPDSEQTNWQNKENLMPIWKGNTHKPKPVLNRGIAQPLTPVLQMR